jgi:hypothetical protein
MSKSLKSTEKARKLLRQCESHQRAFLNVGIAMPLTNASAEVTHSFGRPKFVPANALMRRPNREED